MSNRSEYYKEWRRRNPNYDKEQRNRNLERHRQICRETAARRVDARRIYIAAHREEINAQQRLFRENNPDKVKLARDKWKQSNPDYQRNRYNNNPQIMMTERCRRRLLDAVRKAKGKKSSNTMDLIGCSPVELVIYLESLFSSGMSWENRRQWHIDHIRPCAAFDLTDPEQQRKCFHYTNLQPLWAADNRKKGMKCLD